MRKNFTFPIFLYFLLFVLLFPKESGQITLNTLVLWYQSVIPALLPSMIFIQYYLQSMDVKPVSVPLGILLGLCCGFPVGSLIVTSWMKKQKITSTEAILYMAFLNQFSLSFLINYVSGQILHISGIGFVIHYYSLQLLSYGIPAICLFCKKRETTAQYEKKDFGAKETLPFTDNSPSFGNAILKSSEILLKLYGYMLICNLFSKSLSYLIPNSELILIADLFTEVTGGLMKARHNLQPFALQPVCHAAISFGGICTILQVIPIIKKANLSVPFYILLKCYAAIISALLTLYFPV
jgi:hypothetical protein